MYNSKRFETVKNMRENKKISNAVQAAIGVLAVVLAALIVWMMVLVSGIQGTARVVNYAGLVRGETQRLVKMEIAGQAEDEMMESVESFINGLRFGDDELTLVRLDDKSFQTKMEELASCFESLKQEIYLVREKGFEKTDIIDKSEKFFDVCDDATGLAETYSQKRASSLAVLERYITADIVVLMMLIGYEFIKALHYTAMNHALQKKVYMDEATGLPNKNKCEELLSAPKMITMPVGVCSFDLNNLRRINNSMGHEKGDAYIRIFAELVREAVPAHYFVGRAGGDEFIAIMDGADKEEMQRCLQLIRDRVDTYNAANPDFPVSYAVGISVSDENENCTMRDLYILADKNMYINKNHVKREEALAEKLLERYASGEKQVTVEYCERVSGSETRWIQKTALMMSSRVYDAKSGEEKPMIHSLVLLKNTTEFHAQEQKEHERLRAEVDEATLANKAKTEFLSRMSHDIRTPINGVMGMLEIIKKNREDHERVDDCLEKIHVSSEHLLSLINDVLDMSKLESGHMEPEHVPFDLDDLMKNVRALNEAQVAKTSIVYTYGKISFAHAKLIGSPLHLRQILLNLFSNAAKYNKENGTIETYAEEIACDENTATFRFTIRDTGIGMSKDFVNNELFEPFTQEKQGARTQYQGTGLGMSIVKELIEKMNGTITVESVLGEGSAFTVTLPFEIDKHPSAQAAANGAADETALHGLKVLLAEDNELNMEIAEFFLEDMGAETMQAWNGKEAVEAFRNSAPGEIGVILMDIMMPVMDGLEAVQRIRALDRPDAKTVPIIAMTANAFSEDVERSRKAGMTEHLSKPLNAETLKKAILRNI